MSDCTDDSSFDEFDDDGVVEALLASDIASSQTKDSDSPDTKNLPSTTDAETESTSPGILDDPYADPLVESLMLSEACFKTEPAPSDLGNSTPLGSISPDARLKRKRGSDAAAGASTASKKPRDGTANQAAGVAQTSATHPAVVEPYRINFGGLYRNKTLDDLPSWYINFLIDKEIYLARPDLESALRARGLLKTNFSEAAVDKELLTWRLPPLEAMENEEEFWDEFEEAPVWIAPKDAKNYFGVDFNLLRRARIKSLRGKAPHQLPLYQVYACAEHFKTVTAGTTRQALDQFLRKNEAREKEILRGSYFASCDCCD